uniref:hemicentin-2-like n=1 Tax=Panthera onca TaxID=9690 RepID=UPI0029557E7F|nr:hemicentin-2-like [Panthera onca]
MDDAGRYQCLAENEMGAVEKVVTLVLQSAPVFRVEPRDVTARSGDDVALQCQASGEPVPTVEWLRAGQPVRAGRRLQTLPDGGLWLQRVEAQDAGIYECVAHNLLGSATARAVLAVRGEPRGSRGGVSGVINGQEFGMATLNTSVRQEARSGVTTIWSGISHIPASVGPLMRVLLVTVAPVYWALAGETGDALNGHSLTGGSFLQKSHVEFATGELLTMTQEARGLDPDGLLLLDVVVSGVVPGSLADADLEAQVGTHPEACRWGWGANGMCCPKRPLLTPQAGPGAWPGPDLAQWEGALGPASRGQVSSPFHKPKGSHLRKGPQPARGRGDRPTRLPPPATRGPLNEGLRLLPLGS